MDPATGPGTDPGTEDALLLAAARLVMAVTTRAADQVGDLSPVQLRALTVLDQLGTANLVQLTEAMDVTASTTSRLVDRLVAADLVDRRPSETTRREIALRLTGAGATVLARYDELRVAGLRNRIAGLGSADRATVLAGLATLVGAEGPAAPG